MLIKSNMVGDHGSMFLFENRIFILCACLYSIV